MGEGTTETLRAHGRGVAFGVETALEDARILGPPVTPESCMQGLGLDSESPASLLHDFSDKIGQQRSIDLRCHGSE